LKRPCATNPKKFKSATARLTQKNFRAASAVARLTQKNSNFKAASAVAWLTQKENYSAVELAWLPEKNFKVSLRG
jgi:hypothetical protein